MTAKERNKSEGSAGDPAGAPLEGPGFEASLQRLEAIVKTLEGGELPLEETLRLFEEGQGLLRTCGELLGRAELRVQELLRRGDGELELRERPGARTEIEGAGSEADALGESGSEDAQR